MRLLIDTHFLVWLLRKPNQVSDRERRVLERPTTSVHVSALSLWEVRLKSETLHRRGRDDLYPTADEAHEFAVRAGYGIHPLTAEVCGASLRHPIDHHDPFDVMMLIHAERLDARLLTRDDRLLAHPLALKP